MDKALIKKHLNTIDFVMKHLQTEVDKLEEKRKDIKEGHDFTFNLYLYVLKEHICDLDTIRQEYQKELDK